MTNSIAIVFALLIAGAITLDVTLNDSAALIFTARKGLDLLSYIAFWR